MRIEVLCPALLLCGLVATAQKSPHVRVIVPGTTVNCTAGDSLQRALTGLSPGAVLYVSGLEALAGSRLSTDTAGELQLTNNLGQGLFADGSDVNLNGSTPSQLTSNQTDVFAAFGRN